MKVEVSLSASWQPRQVSAPLSVYCVPWPTGIGARAAGADAPGAVGAADAEGAEAAVSACARAGAAHATRTITATAASREVVVFIGVRPSAT